MRHISARLLCRHSFLEVGTVSAPASGRLTPRGLWRRATVDGVRADEWQVLLDLDALAAAEGENWVWSGATGFRPDYRRFLVWLSRGGSDACEIREFDLETGFVSGGFELPEAKSWISWIDIDTIFVSTDFGPGSLTNSGYPRLVKRWRRGTPLARLPTPSWSSRRGRRTCSPPPSTTRHPASPVTSSSAARRSSRATPTCSMPQTSWYGSTCPEMPPSTCIVSGCWYASGHRGRSALPLQTYPEGALLAAEIDQFLAGERTLTVLFDPAVDVTLEYWMWTRYHLVLGLLRDVHSELVVLDPADGWVRAPPLDGVPPLSHTGIADTNPDLTDEFLLTSTGFTEPTTLRHGTIGGPVG